MLNELKAQHKIVAETRSIGLLAAIDLKKPNSDEPLVLYRAKGDALKPTKALNQALKKAGVSTMVRFGTIIIAPPLNINKDELKLGIKGIGEALASFDG